MTDDEIEHAVMIGKWNHFCGEDKELRTSFGAVREAIKLARAEERKGFKGEAKLWMDTQTKHIRANTAKQIFEELDEMWGIVESAKYQALKKKYLKR